MQFPKPLIHGKLIERYKRFLADIELDTGEIVVAHCTNSGSMKTCLENGAEVYLTHVDDPKRKTKYTWEMIQINGDWVGINTGIPNVLVYEAVRDQEIEELRGYTEVKREVKFEDSRFDVFAQNEQETCFIEVKNVSMKVGEYARFPDAVTTRGKKHLETLMRVKEAGMRAVMCYVIQRSDVSNFGPAWDIDPAYAEALKKAIERGVEVFAFQAEVNPEGIRLVKRLPVDLTTNKIKVNKAE
ncbi:sugar fermentation stimulation protein A [Ancylomarina subtilis]|uniref:Sugar fermentation stimulation protein homolog n=1 Tax=Ancylomarina subtilis TaxID=1639035 RepID=A0A4Q7VIJ0_9BACT|nr:DNA/RNA nuclease SfsA [Ancylomarina subtilis]RZT95952.1 sugar fermentation stimulation protein A [Ancylomarina subtilis]